MNTKWLNVVILLLATGFMSSAMADIAWDGDALDTLWRTGTNWSLDRVPAVGDGAVFINNQTNGPLVLVDSSTTVSIDCDIFGPEWGMTLEIDGGNLATTGWSFAPVGDVAAPSIINVRNGGNLTVHNLLLGDNWWFWTAPGVIMNVYDTSTVTATDWCWLGGKMNLYGGTVDITGSFNMNANLQNNAHLDIEAGTLIIRGADLSTAVADWIAAGQLTAYGLTPGSGADIIVDSTTVPGGTVITAVYNYPATNPSVTPLNPNGTVGDLVGSPGSETVNATLNWWAGGDPNNVVNPNILTHYVYLSGGEADPNLYYEGSVAQISLTDPNASYALTGLSQNTLYYWSVEEGLDDGTGSAYPAGDPNNIEGPIWSFLTKAATPVITADPVNATADPDATFMITDDGIATSYQWYKVGTPDTALSDTGAYSGTGTATLTVTNASVAEEGQYYCVAINGTKTDTSASAYLWTQRLMGHWKFDGNMLDSVAVTVTGAPAHDGAIAGNGSGDPNYVVSNGPDGSDSMQFFNDGDFVAIDDADFFNFYPLGFTMSFWYKENATVGWRLPASKLDGGVAGWLFGVDTATRGWPIFFTNPDDDAAYWADGDDTMDLADGLWHMITAVYDPADTTYTIFTDGDENESIVLDLSAYPLAAAPLSIGGRDTESSVDGFIDDVRIYSVALTPLQIAQLYVAFETDKWVCVEDPENPLNAYDLTGDCRVNLADFAEFAAKWLECQRYPATSCNL